MRAMAHPRKSRDHVSTNDAVSSVGNDENTPASCLPRTWSVAALVGVVYRGVASDYEGSWIAINRENTFGVSLSKLAGRLSVR